MEVGCDGEADAGCGAGDDGDGFAHVCIRWEFLVLRLRADLLVNCNVCTI